jgi:hypothetical protein
MIFTKLHFANRFMDVYATDDFDLYWGKSACEAYLDKIEVADRLRIYSFMGRGIPRAGANQMAFTTNILNGIK